MRVEPFAVGSYVHVMKRGARGLPITRTSADKWRFTRLLYFMNEMHQDENWESNIANLNIFERPPLWPDRQPLTRILGWVLMPNHFHLMLEEVQEGGTSKFMQRLCGSMTSHFNAKYKEKGSIFQGSYKSKTIKSDSHLRQLIPYIMVKNVFELYPKGYEAALKDFEKAWQWGTDEYAFSSLPEYAGDRAWPISEGGIIKEIFSTKKSFKSHAQEIILSRSGVGEELQKITFE